MRARLCADALKRKEGEKESKKFYAVIMMVNVTDDVQFHGLRAAPDTMVSHEQG